MTEIVRGSAVRWLAAAGSLAMLLLAGCHHHQQTSAPPPPAVAGYGGGGYGGTGSAARVRPPGPAGPGTSGPLPAPAGFFDDTTGAPVSTETGLATWYYARVRAGSDGVAYGTAAPTAANKTLPLGTTVRVTNLQTGQWTLVRITDRGPFVPGRILDLSEVAAKQIGMYRIGVVPVRIEAFAHPGADPAGRWCVQTGPFQTERDAADLKHALVERYRGSRVSDFLGSTGYWVRIDPAGRSRAEAAAVDAWVGSPDQAIHSYLVRVN